MDDQAALQEAIQRARQLAAKITQSAPVKRPAPSDHSGPVKVTLAYEKPANSETLPRHHEPRDRSPERQDRPDRQRRPDLVEHRGDRNDRHSHMEHDPISHRDRLASDEPFGGNERDKQKIELIIPHAVIGLVIGKGGENIKRIQNETGATVRVDPTTVDEKGNKLCTITGTKQAIDDAHIQISGMIENSATSKRPRLQGDSKESYRMKIPAQRTGAIIGKGGETIKSIKQQSGCDIEIDRLAHDSTPDETVFVIRGTSDKILKAKQLIEARLAQGRGGGGGERGGGERGGSERGGSERGGERGGGRDGRRDHHGDHNHSNSRSSHKGVATGANAAPVAPYTDLPLLGQPQPQQPQHHHQQPQQQQQQQIPNTTDMTAAWAAYYAQYQALYAQAQPQTQAQPAATILPYVGQPVVNQQVPQLNHSQQPATAAASITPMQPNAGADGATGQPDYTNAWIEYYIQQGKPDYAKRLIDLIKQSQENPQPNDNQ